MDWETMELNFNCFTYKNRLWTYHDGKLKKVILKNLAALDTTSPGWDISFKKDFTIIDIETTRGNTYFTKSDKIVITLENNDIAEKWYGEDW